MRVLLLSWSILAVSVWQVLGIPALPMSYYSYAVQISLPSASGTNYGSGFLMKSSNSIFLVTARHVIFKPDSKAAKWTIKTPQIEFSAFCTFGTNVIKTFVTIDANELNRKNEVRCSATQDVALIRFGFYNPTNDALITALASVIFKVNDNRAYFNTATAKDILLFPDALSVGSDVYLMGFPISIGLSNNEQFERDHPLLRRGIIAGLNKSKRTILLDCPVYQGNSGGPVIMREQPELNRFEYRVIGIAVEFVPFVETWESKNFGIIHQYVSNSGYSVVVPGEAIMAMVW